jgi:glycosyltransferase involved in cell wall biosynthesis
MKPQGEKINLLFLLQTFRTGGSERVVKDLCDNLNKNRFNCSVIAFVDGDMHELFKQMGIPTLCVNKEKHDAWKVMQQISAFIRTHQVRVINAHHFTPFFYGLYGAKRHGCKIFYTAHSIPEVDLIGTFWSMLGSILLRLSEGAIGISPGISEAIKRQFRLSDKKVLTITNAVNHSRFVVNIDVKEKKKDLNINEDEQVIGCVGNLRQQKNYPNLIKAFKIVESQLGKVRLIIVGEGKRKDDLEALIKELGLNGKVLLLGARNDVPEIMKVIDVYCLPSFYEGLPLSLLEAMSAGLPVVGTDVPGIQDVIIHERNGLLAPPDNPGELSKALIRMLTDRRLAQDLSENGRQYVVQTHGMENWIQGYESLFFSTS